MALGGAAITSIPPSGPGWATKETSPRARLKVQVKHGDTRIGPPVLQAFTALLRDGDAGLFVATGGCSREAEEFARLHCDRLTLIDLPRFVELWAEHEARLDVRARARLPLTRVVFLETSSTSMVPEPSGEVLPRDAIPTSP